MDFFIEHKKNLDFTKPNRNEEHDYRSKFSQRTTLSPHFLSPLSEQTPLPFVKGIWAAMAITWSKAHKWNGPNKVESMSRWEGEIYVW